MGIPHMFHCSCRKVCTEWVIINIIIFNTRRRYLLEGIKSRFNTDDVPRAARRLYSHCSFVMVRVRIPTFRTYPLPQPPQIYPYPFWTDSTDSAVVLWGGRRLYCDLSRDGEGSNPNLQQHSNLPAKCGPHSLRAVDSEPSPSEAGKSRVLARCRCACPHDEQTPQRKLNQHSSKAGGAGQDHSLSNCQVQRGHR